MAERLIIIMNHQKHRLVERVDYITSPGFLDGGEARARAGLAGSGPAAVITDRAILRPHGPENELHLTAIHPGHTVEEIVENTGWALKSAPSLGETPPPSAEEMAALHRIDKEGFWRS
jgi:glutaconate CoA-transferase subunit B